MHNISIPDEGIDVDIPVGGNADVVVTFPTRAPIVYVCKYHDFDEQAGELFTVSG